MRQHFAHTMYVSHSLLNELYSGDPTNKHACPGHVAGSGEKRNKYRIVVWKP